MIKFIYSAIAAIILILPLEVFSQDYQMNKMMIGANAGFISDAGARTIKGSVGQVAATTQAGFNEDGPWFVGYWGPSWMSFVSVEEKIDGVGRSVTNYPNPATHSTSIKFDLEVSSYVSVRVYDINGNAVMNLSDQLMGAGSNQIDWDTRAKDGQPVAAGTYLYEVKVKSAGSVVNSRNYMMRNIMVINR